MKIYLAAAWSRLEEIAQVGQELTELGVEITSRWLTEERSLFTNGGLEKFMRERAYVDLEDVDRADGVVRFADKTDEPLCDSRLISGARHFEFGYAKARGKTLYVVGGRQNVFDRLDGVVHVKDKEELKRLLIPYEVN
jgi:nucleoside 2-deoxyribosyltransferase